MDVVFCPTCTGVDNVLERPRTLQLTQNPPQPFHFFFLNGLTWIDWVGIIGLTLTAIGFSITWWQLYRTQTARQAVTEFITTSNREIANVRLTKTLNSLLVLDNKANDASRKDDSIALQKALHEWTLACSRVIPQLGTARALPERARPHRWSHQETDQIPERAIEFVAARVTVDEALWKLRSSGRKRRLTTEIAHALGKMHEVSILAATIIEESEYRKVS